MSGFTGGWIPEAYGAPTEFSEVNRLANFFSGESLAAFVRGRSQGRDEDPGEVRDETRAAEVE